MMVFRFGREGKFEVVIVDWMGRVGLGNENGLWWVLRDKGVVWIGFR